jgi:hypothetical protein
MPQAKSGAPLSRLLAVATPLLPVVCLAQSPVFTVQSLGGETISVNRLNDVGDSVGTANEGIFPCPAGCVTVATVSGRGPLLVKQPCGACLGFHAGLRR